MGGCMLAVETEALYLSHSLFLRSIFRGCHRAFGRRPGELGLLVFYALPDLSGAGGLLLGPDALQRCLGS